VKRLLAASLALALLPALPPALAAARDTGLQPAARRLVVLGVDGLDPDLVREYMQAGGMRNLAKLAAEGDLVPLGTSVPPQSPVAWSNFITGMDPGGHGLFDFLALDRKTLLPYLSSARVEREGSEPISLGRWRIPLGSERTVLLRDGRAFWELLEEAGIHTTMFRIPANYPPVHTAGQALSGMGTPDLKGTPGTFSYYSNAPWVSSRNLSGGVLKRITVERGVVRSEIEGPPNYFLRGSPSTLKPFSVFVDPENPVAMIEIEGTRHILNVGEWSDWIRIEFSLAPGISIPGMVRFFVRQTSPFFALYASPVNIDPRDPAQPIADPAAYAFDLAESVGPFYTQEMPEDTKALNAGVLSPTEFLEQSELVLKERGRLLRHELRNFHETPGDALLFFYISSVDQRHHMMSRYMDPQHPFYRSDVPKTLADAMRTVYGEIDELVGEVMQALDENTTLVVMSDHGFAPFRHQVHLNKWLEEKGYLTLKQGVNRDQADWLQGVDWSRTRAFAIGLNSLYLNTRGRERFGIVEPAAREALAREIAQALNSWTDPNTKERVITQAVVREDVYHGPHVSFAPDIIVGYARGYRASWATTTGKVPNRLIEDNLQEWSGDHCMDSRSVPGVLVSSHPISAAPADLRDLTVTILDFFGVQVPPQMKGHSVF
jgi:predicted AlkP superfamily phosphohydrolase/phosphomutase